MGELVGKASACLREAASAKAGANLGMDFLFPTLLLMGPVEKDRKDCPSGLFAAL